MRKFLITGGAGFIGSNLADYFLRRGVHVIIYDNFSRPNVKWNVKWLKTVHRNSKMLTIIRGDVRDYRTLKKAAQDVDVIFHTAAQVAVTTSIIDPLSDLETNVMGTVNVLETARNLKTDPVVIY